jgi:hypothetical protein
LAIAPAGGWRTVKGAAGYRGAVWNIGQPISVRQADSSGVSYRPDR